MGLSFVKSLKQSWAKLLFTFVGLTGWPKKIVFVSLACLLLAAPFFWQALLSCFFCAFSKGSFRKFALLSFGVSFPFAVLSLWDFGIPRIHCPPAKIILNEAESSARMVPEKNVACNDSGEAGTHYSEYTISDFGTRVSAVGERVAPEARKVLFFGCSFTFGLYVSDGDSFPSVVARESGGYLTAMNYGIPGGGLQFVPLLLRGIKEDEAGKNPLLVYTMLSSHPRRYFKTSSWSLQSRFIARGFDPILELRNGRLVYAGNAADWIFPKLILFKIGIRNYVRLVLLLRSEEVQRDQAGLLDSEVKEKFVLHFNALVGEFFHKFPRGVFVLNIWESESLAPTAEMENWLWLTSRIDARVKVVVYPNAVSLSRLVNRGASGHPDVSAYSAMGKWLYIQLLPFIN